MILRRVGAAVRRHKHAIETLAEAVGINIAWRVIATVLAASAASAAITAVTTEQHATYHPSFALSTKGAAFLTRNEGLRLSPYNDPFNCTVGVGHLIHYGRCSSGDYVRWRISNAQAMTLLMRDSGWASRCINERLTRPITQYQADALTDLAFNAGCGSLDYSGIANQINRGDLVGVPRTLSHTAVTANGHYLSGLYTRRLAEGTLFARGFYGAGIGYFLPGHATSPLHTKTQPWPKNRPWPKPVPQWSWKWAAWELGRTPYRGHAHEARLRPRSAPKHVPAWAWRWLKATFLKGTR